MTLALPKPNSPRQNTMYTNGATTGTACSRRKSAARGARKMTTGTSHQYGPFHNARTNSLKVLHRSARRLLEDIMDPLPS